MTKDRYVLATRKVDRTFPIVIEAKDEDIPGISSASVSKKNHSHLGPDSFPQVYIRREWGRRSRCREPANSSFH